MNEDKSMIGVDVPVSLKANLRELARYRGQTLAGMVRSLCEEAWVAHVKSMRSFDQAGRQLVKLLDELPQMPPEMQSRVKDAAATWLAEAKKSERAEPVEVSA